MTETKKQCNEIIEKLMQLYEDMEARDDDGEELHVFMGFLETVSIQCMITTVGNIKRGKRHKYLKHWITKFKNALKEHDELRERIEKDDRD